MKRPGVYYHKKSGKIWLATKVEYYDTRITPRAFSLIIEGSWNGEKAFNRCYVPHSLFKEFLRLGDF